MKDNELNPDELNDQLGDDGQEASGSHAHSSYQVPKDKKLQLSGMYETWFLDYASYVCLLYTSPSPRDRG